MHDPATDTRSREGIENWIHQWLVNELELGRDVIDASKTFLAYGMNSIQAMMLVGDLEDELKCRLSPTLLWDHPSPAKLVAYIADDVLNADTASGVSVVQETHKTTDEHETTTRQILERLDDLSEEEIDALLREHLRKPG